MGTVRPMENVMRYGPDRPVADIPGNRVDDFWVKWSEIFTGISTKNLTSVILEGVILLCNCLDSSPLQY